MINSEQINITNIIKDYLNLAPLNAFKNVSSDAAMWEKHHIRLNTENNATVAGSMPVDIQTPRYDYYFKEPMGIDSTNPTFINRERAYTDKARPSQYRGNNLPRIIQTRFQDEFIKLDKRASYASSKYPWIEAVDVFDNPLSEHYVYNNQASMARFKIPARHGPGDYVVWFYWSGYRDCVDVNVMAGSAPVALRYGYNTTGMLSQVIKQDHCEYTYIPDARTMARKVNNITRDISLCIADARRANSAGVQVVRAFNPAGALPFPVNLPYIRYEYAEPPVGVINPCRGFSVYERLTNNCTKAPGNNLRPGMFGQLNEDDFICFGVSPLRNQDNQVEEDYTIASDPQDPVFYSTCFQFVPVGGFLNVPPITYTPPSWSVGDKCIDCDFYASLSKLNYTQIPDWSKGISSMTTGGGCIPCDLVNSEESVAVLQPLISGANKPNAGI